MKFHGLVAHNPKTIDYVLSDRDNSYTLRKPSTVHFGDDPDIDLAPGMFSEISHNCKISPFRLFVFSRHISRFCKFYFIFYYRTYMQCCLGLYVC